jgi:hypothetical protein
VPVKSRDLQRDTRTHTHKQGKGSTLPAACVIRPANVARHPEHKRGTRTHQPGIPVGCTAPTLHPGSTNHLSIATDFLSTCPHTPRVEEPHPATLCRIWNSTDDSMLSTGRKIMHKTPCIQSAIPKQQLPKSVDNKVLHVPRMRCNYTRTLLGCTAKTLAHIHKSTKCQGAARAYQGQRNVHIRMHKAVSVAKYERRRRMHM